MNKLQLWELLEPLLKLPTAPFHEDAVAAFVTSTLAGTGVHVATDSHGNIVARRPSAGRNIARLAFMAHMDHPGFEVIEHGDDGVIAEWFGGVQPEYFDGARVRFHAGDERFPGVVTGYELDEAAKRVTRTTVACERKPPVGAFGMWDLPEAELLNGALRAPAIDDVAGVGLLLAMLLGLGDRPLETEVWTLFTRAEEVGFIGAIALAKTGRLPLSMPILSVEMSKAMSGASLGLGPVIRLGDRSSVFDHNVLLFMKDVAADLKARTEGFKYQQLLMDGGSCEATAFNAFGFKTGGLAIPLSNYHNQRPAGPNGPWVLDAEEISFSDLLNAVDLSVALCESYQGLEIVKTHHRLALLERTEERLDRLFREQRQRER